MNREGRLRRLLLRLPTLSATAASNHQLIQERLQVAFQRLADVANSGADPDDVVASNIRRELDELQQILDKQHATSVAHHDPLESRISKDRADRSIEPCATYLKLYSAEIAKGNYAGAGPWLERYCLFEQTRSEVGSLKPRYDAKRWRGPLNRKR